jgi:ABC-type transport system substrate-binding protein
VAQPGQLWYRPDFAALLNGIAIEPAAIELQFNRVYVRPEALLQFPPPGSKPRFEISEHGDGQVVFAASPGSGSGSGLRAIVEQTLPDDEAAVDAIVSGEIDVLDRVPPWQVERLRGAKGIRVGAYRLPTVHVLIPNTKGLLLAKREFRRAICFGIDRKWIVSSVLLGGQSQTGFDVLSGPFPSGLSISDPIRYGYNNRINPRSYEPRLAAILATIGWAAANNPTGRKEDAPKNLPEMPELNLAHPHPTSYSPAKSSTTFDTPSSPCGNRSSMPDRFSANTALPAMCPAARCKRRCGTSTRPAIGTTSALGWPKFTISRTMSYQSYHFGKR